MSSDALFYKDKDGKKQDKNIHEAWLAEGDDRAARMAGLQAARASGMDEDLIQLVYGDLLTGDSDITVVADVFTGDVMPPRPLYVRRDVLNASEIYEHFSQQGLEDLEDPAEMHVTVCYSKDPVDWLEMGETVFNQGDDGTVKVAPGGPRYVDRLGDDGSTIVQVFASSSLSYRHEDLKNRGASHGYDGYIPHITILQDAPPEIDVSEIEPWRGEIVLGPEIFEEVKPEVEI